MSIFMRVGLQSSDVVGQKGVFRLFWGFAANR
jgi:hypothetical protein